MGEARISNRIRRARPDEAGKLSGLALRSKATWGYTTDQMAIFADELTLTPEKFEPQATCVLEYDGRIVGYYILCRQSEAAIELEHLFVDAPMLRQGFGSVLFEHARKEAIARGFTRMSIQSDPNAEGFYLAHGARTIRQIPTSIPNRTLPLMEILLTD